MAHDPVKKPDAAAGRTGRGADPTPHVLLVEDDDVMREMLTEAFGREGWKVTQAADGERWLQACISEATSVDIMESTVGGLSYDVVVSDIRMPNTSGLDVLRILNELRCSGVCPPTIFITAFGDAATHAEARRLGAVTVFDKPFDIKALIRAIRSIIGTRRRGERMEDAQGC